MSAQKMSNVVSQLMARRGYGQANLADQLTETWRDVVDGRFVQDSQPTCIKAGVLEIIVRNSTVLQELTFSKVGILAKLGEHELTSKVVDLRFRVGSLA